MFDLAAVVEHYGEDYAIAALSQCGARACHDALAVIEKAKSEFVISIMNQLMVRDGRRHLITNAQGISREILSQIVRRMSS